MAIDVRMVVANAFWIVGLAVLLSAWSLAYARAHRAGQKVRELLATFGYARAIDGGLLLVVIGLAATEARPWARVIWIAMALALATVAVIGVVQHGRGSEEQEDATS